MSEHQTNTQTKLIVALKAAEQEFKAKVMKTAAKI